MDETADAYTPSQLTELFRLEKLLVERRAQTNRLRAMLELSHRMEAQLTEQRQRTAYKQQQLSQRAYLVEQASTLLDHRRARHNEQQERAHIAMAQTRDTCALVNRQVVGLRQERIILEDLRAMLAKERAKKIHCLMDIFDIGVASSDSDGGMWCVCGLRADFSDAGVLAEEVAAALGLVCRAVDLAARYLAAPLRFPVVPRGSRSAVCVVNGSGAAAAAAELLPLFVGRRGDRFAVARRALATDIDQLLWVYGLDGYQQQLLPGLLQLLMAIESSSFAS